MEQSVEYLEKNRAILTLSGRLDAHTSPEMRKALMDTVKKDYVFIVIDMAEVNFVDSSGLSAIVSGYRSVQQQNGALALTHVGPQAMVALKQTRLNRVLKVYEDTHLALSSFDDLEEDASAAASDDQSSS